MALILAHLRPSKASAVLGGLDDGQASEVARCIATMGPVAPEVVSIVAEVLKERAGSVVSPGKSTENVGGIQPIVDILTRSDTRTERTVLDGLDILDSELAGEVRAQMLTLKDIVRLERRDLQQILRGVSPELLATALKGAAAVALEAVRNNISDRNREILEFEMANSGPVRPRKSKRPGHRSCAPSARKPPTEPWLYDTRTRRTTSTNSTRNSYGRQLH
ncbi:FliG C-terminal domain-containing protein [Arthrobacter sp. NPDC080031]|uniref:FliG C-terminal domain-containing protein n=1 Tax=Arthrobacter sp. NPDC080031 TaxID=3155918 RepID=UPI00344E2F0C